jgi:hypothetical protein
MTSAAIPFITYLWHYLVARLLYDHLVRPLIHSRVSVLALVCAIALAAFAFGWWSRSGRDGPLTTRRRT